MGDELQQGALAVLPLLPEPVAGQPIILPLLAQAGLARAGGSPYVLNIVPAQPQVMLRHITSRIWASTLECGVQIVPHCLPLGFYLKTTQ